MKSAHILAASIAALCVTHSASAANVTLRLSGASAFRGAATTAVKNVLSGGNPAISYAGGTIFTNATYVTFVGTLPGVTGTVTVKCAWSGAISALRDVVQANSENYLADGVASSVGSGTSVATSLATDAVAPDVVFADSIQASAIYTSPVLNGNSLPQLCVIEYAFVKSRGALSKITNITRQQFRWLIGNAYAPAYLWTGDAADTQPIWAFGRDPFAGQRQQALTETGYGANTPVIQFTPTKITGSGVKSQIKTIDQTPDGGTVGGISLDNGNNGEATAAALSDSMRHKSTKVSDGYGLFSNMSMGFITYLSENDANRAVWGFGSTVGYNSNSTGKDRAAYLSYEGVAGFQGEAKNSVAGTISGGNTLTLSSVGPVADANHEGATAGTTGLVVGQAISGTGITPGSIIATIVNGTTLTLDLAQPMAPSAGRQSVRSFPR